MKTKFKARFRDLLCPELWPYPMSLEQAFQVFRWMAATGRDYRTETRWGSLGPTECLSMTSAIGLSGVRPVTSVEDLRQRFVAAFFSRVGGKATERWRRECGIHPDGEVWIPARHYDLLGKSEQENSPFRCHADLENCLTDLLAADGNLAVSPNAFHPAARAVKRVSINTGRPGFLFELDYGYEGSVWTLNLAKTEDDEPFADTLARGAEHYRLLTEPAIPAAERVEALKAIRPREWYESFEWCAEGDAVIRQWRVPDEGEAETAEVAPAP